MHTLHADSALPHDRLLPASRGLKLLDLALETIPAPTDAVILAQDRCEASSYTFEQLNHVRTKGETSFPIIIWKTMETGI